MRIGDWSSDVCSSDVDPDRPRLDAAGQHAADEIVAVEQGRKEAERPVGVETGGGNMADDRFEQRLEIAVARLWVRRGEKTEEHTSELPSLMRISYAVFCLKKKTKYTTHN